MRALCVSAGVAGLVLLTLASDPAAHAGGKKKDDDAKYIAQINQLRAQLKQRENIIDNLQAALKKVAKEENKDDLRIAILNKKIDQLEAQLKKATKDDTQDDKAVKELAALKKAPYVHALILKLKDPGDKEHVGPTVADADKLLGKAAGVRGLWAGKAGGTEFQVGIIVLLDGPGALQKLLNDPNYKQFAKKAEKHFEKPSVYDFHE